MTSADSLVLKFGDMPRHAAFQLYLLSSDCSCAWELGFELQIDHSLYYLKGNIGNGEFGVQTQLPDANCNGFNQGFCWLSVSPHGTTFPHNHLQAPQTVMPVRSTLAPPTHKTNPPPTQSPTYYPGHPRPCRYIELALSQYLILNI